MLTIYLNGKPMKMQVDSGSACSIISEEISKSLWPVKGPKITVTKKSLQTWWKQKLDTLGTTDVEVQWKDSKNNFSLLVVKGVGASLLERNWFDALGITINGEHHILEKQPEAILQEYQELLKELETLGIDECQRKCVLATDEVEFLGFRINARGIQHTQDKVKAILAAPRPTNQTELQTFLGLSSSVLAHYNTILPLQVTCYAPPYGVGAVLSHVMSDDTETPVAYASKTLTATKRNYAQIDKEALAIVFRVKKFHQYLYEAQKQVVMDMLHQAHPGIMRIKALARSYEWWPRIDNYVEQMVQRYKPCEESRNAPERAPVHIWTIGKKLTNHDSYSKWLEVRPVLTTSSALAISNLRHLFTTHGLPEALSDNATAFTSKEFQNFMLSNAIRHITITPYHPAWNGQAEQMVQTIKKALQRIVKGYWNIHLARFLLSQHITLNSKIGLSPAELLMHRRARTLWDNLHPDRANISSNRQNIQQRNAENAKETRTYKNYSKEDKWIPSIIKRQSGPVSYDTRTSKGERHRRHVDQHREGSPEERRAEDTEVGNGNTERITATDAPDGPDEHRPVQEMQIKIFGRIYLKTLEKESSTTDNTVAETNPHVDIGMLSHRDGRDSSPVEAAYEPTRESGSLQQGPVREIVEREIANTGKPVTPHPCILTGNGSGRMARDNGSFFNVTGVPFLRQAVSTWLSVNDAVWRELFPPGASRDIS
ncbi:Uncharacterized protein T4E_11024 [Trichinella pseudospiralis]|uniref:Integrase catalytic domain-containing protein n=1 Tax=Trichinella pseudospiralis TaxID=6337 RepID=A0A0V0XIN4_TRIPS|nr:Uncharacterized protein T4E_11024 [Trichinella pseudospiralis]